MAELFPSEKVIANMLSDTTNEATKRQHSRRRIRKKLFQKIMKSYYEQMEQYMFCACVCVFTFFLQTRCVPYHLSDEHAAVEATAEK